MACSKGKNFPCFLLFLIIFNTVAISSSPLATNADDEFEITLQKLDKTTIEVSWIVGNHSAQPNNSISSFILSYTISPNSSSDWEMHKDSDNGGSHNSFRSNSGIEFRTNNLDPSVRSLTLHLPISYDVKICVTANHNGGNNMTKGCSDWLKQIDEEAVEKEFDIKRAAGGIVAGALFLVPCAVLVGYIYKKDRQIRKTFYNELNQDHWNGGFEIGSEEKKPGEGGQLERKTETPKSAEKKENQTNQKDADLEGGTDPDKEKDSNSTSENSSATVVVEVDSKTEPVFEDVRL